MKRKLSLLLAVVMILGSFSFTFAAETTAEEAAGNFLMEQGVIEGINGELKLDDNFRRQDMVVMLSRLMGEEDTAMAFPTDSLTFTDFSDPYYRPIIAWAVAEGLIEGHTPERFGFGENVTAQQYATVLLRALGYGEEVSGDGYANALDLAKELGVLGDLELDNSTVVTRGQMYVLTVNALGTAMKDSEETLADKLGVEMPEPEVLEVVGVYADNLKEVVVEFNKPVDASTVTDKNVYIKDKGVEGSVLASEDGMSAVITVSGILENQEEYTVVVKGVKDTDGFEVAETELAFKAFDATLPEAVDIVVTGPKSFNIVFSEPIDDADKAIGKVKVKQGNTTIGNKVEVNDNVASVTLFRTLKDDEEYSVTVSDFHDFAGYKNVVDTLTFVYEKDETPPVATVVKAEQAYVVVEFDKPVSGLKAENFYHTFTAWEAVGVYKDAKGTEIDGPTTKAYVYFYEANNEDSKDSNRPLPEGEVRFGIKEGKNIKDNWGNALGDVEFTVEVTPDKTAPEVVGIEVVAENKLLVKFSENVVFEKKNVEILDEDGNKISGLSWKEPVSKGNSEKEWYVELTKAMSGKTLTVVIKNVEDKAIEPNKLVSYTDLIEITDKTPPKVSSAYYYKEENDKDYETARLMVIFNEEVDGETALVPSNYALIDGTDVVVLTEEPYFDVNSARVIIPLTEDQYKVAVKLKDKEALQVINVEDLAGNAISPALNKISGAAVENNTVKVTSAVATSTNTIVLKFDDLVYNVKNSNFTIEIGENESEKTTIKDFAISQTDTSVTELEIVLNDDIEFKTDLTDLTLKFNPDLDNEDAMMNSFEVPIASLTGDCVSDNIITVADKVAPAIVKDGVKWAKGSDTIIIEYSEKIDAKAISTLVYSVEDATIKEVTVQDNVVTITLDKALEETPVITQELPVYDMYGNAFETDDELTVSERLVDAGRISQYNTTVTGVNLEKKDGKAVFTFDETVTWPTNQDPNEELGGSEDYVYVDLLVKAPDGAAGVLIGDKVVPLDEEVNGTTSQGRLFYFPVAKKDANDNYVGFAEEKTWELVIKWYDSEEKLVEVETLEVVREAYNPSSN